MLGLALSLSAMVLFGLSALFMKPALKHMSKEQLLFFSALAAALVVYPFITPLPNHLSPYAFISMLILTFFNMGGLYFFYMSVEKKGIAISAPIVNAWLPITVLLSIIFYKEMLSLQQLISFVIIFLGVIALSVRSIESMKVDASLAPAFVSLLFLGLYYFFARIPLKFLTPAQIVFFLSLLVAGFSLLSFEGLPKRPKGLIYAMLSGGLGALGFLLFNYALLSLPVSIVSSIVSANLLVAVGGGVMLYREKLSKAQFIGVLLVSIGLVLLSLTL